MDRLITLVRGEAAKVQGRLGGEMIRHGPQKLINNSCIKGKPGKDILYGKKPYAKHPKNKGWLRVLGYVYAFKLTLARDTKLITIRIKS